VINELNHRVKNNLTMTQAIAAQTFRSAEDVAQAQAKFSARIMALAQANDLLTGERGVDVALRGVLEQAVSPHVAEGPDRCRIEGPDIQLSPKTALSLTMAMHELAVNALKYGAWSTCTGKVELTWKTYEAPPGTTRLRLEWRETGGPYVSPPARRGFGSRLIERGLATEMAGTVTMTFDPQGLVCVVDAPLRAHGR
jgi:two-component sensor histidine kinase